MTRIHRPLLVASLFIATFALGACQAPQGASHALEPAPSAAPVSGVSNSCERGCNAEYDACMDRFSAIPGASHDTGRSDDPSNMLGPNGACPDQLKSCLKRCSI